ncbi:hypothetical protein DEO72_LG8g2038 [Vigna unguiculata]|uniref:Uncharacterized protein n=1 Tax=Vigna unguiculata TaxID=3917 RepID=A0A4D6MR91_VIGUN|nr:hypothetical protein DEO72_LG8g2038 [Vigna unguiculata]
MQAFQVLYRVVGLTATMPLFLHFYKTRPTTSKSWVSFLGENKSLFTLYLASYKGFNTGFFKVAIPGRGKKYIFDEEDRPKFPLYWTMFPPPTDPWAEDRLTPTERADLAVLKALPDKIPPRPLIQCLRSPDLPRAVYEIIFPMPSSWLAPRLDEGRMTPLRSTPTGASGVVTRSRFIVKPPSSTFPGAATDKGKKTKRDDSPTGRPSKKNKKAEASGSLATAFLDGEVRLDKEVSFHLGPRVKDMLKDVSEEEALRTAEELTLRPRRHFDDLSLEHLTATGSAADWQKKAKEYQAELRVVDEQVFAQYETGFQNSVDQAVFFYRCSPDRFDVHMGVVEGKLERVFDRLDEATAPPTADS